MTECKHWFKPRVIGEEVIANVTSDNTEGAEETVNEGHRRARKLSKNRGETIYVCENCPKAISGQEYERKYRKKQEGW